MNLLEIIILAAVLWSAVRGFRKGFVKKLAAMVSLVLSIVLVSFFLPYITEFLKTSTPIYGFIEQQCDQTVSEKIEELMASAGLELSDGEPDRIGQISIIDNLPVPQEMKDLLLDYNNDEGYSRLNVADFQEYISTLIATAVLNVLAFVVSVLAVQVLLWAAITLLNLMANIPVIRFVNRIAGMGLGLLQALFLLWIFFLILSMISATNGGMYLMSMVQESQVLRALYESNLFPAIVLRGAAMFV